MDPPPPTLVTPAWVAEHAGDPMVAVAEVRWSPTEGTAGARRVFEEAGHIPGAILVDVDRHLSARPFVDGPGRHPLPDPASFAEAMASLGPHDDTVVVVSDDVRGSIAARLWWMLEVTEHPVSVLDGGLQAWLGEGRPVEHGPALPRERGRFTARPWPGDRIVDADAVALTLRTSAAPVLDARAAERYRGEVEPIDPVAGHIPGARSAPWMGSLDPETGRFLSPDTLRARYRALGVSGPTTICHCGSGVTACHALLSLKLAGFGDARLYEGSWSDWVSEPGRPVATGDGAHDVTT